MSLEPWYEYCTLRKELGDEIPSQEEFAADIYKVYMGVARPVYQNQDTFFDRTYASPNLKLLVRSVLRRLTGISGGNAVIRTQVAYGGGKSHAMLSVYHLVTLRSDLIQNSTVQTLLQFSGIKTPPKARVAILPFDKFDVHDGLDVLSPDRQTKKNFKTPWGALAYQLGGEELFQKVARHEESGISPAQPLMEEILTHPQKEGLATLVIIDEASIYGRSLALTGKFGAFKDFIQYLTQAATAQSVEKVVILATLLHTGMETADLTGQRVLRELTQITDRVGPERIEPITQYDVAEILRRRLFSKIPNEHERKAIANILAASSSRIEGLYHEQKGESAEERYFRSYPFHPDFIEALYGRWIELPKFQRTRGALQLMTVLIRDAYGTDPTPVIGPRTLLGESESGYSQGLSIMVDWTEDGATWSGILQQELNIAKKIQSSKTVLKTREVEQTVVSVFLYSQPEGRKALLNNLLLLIVHPGLNELSSLQTAMQEWRKQSWYHDDTLSDQEWALIQKKNIVSIHDSIINSLSEAEQEKAMKFMETEICRIKWIDPLRDHIKVHCITTGPESVDDSVGLHLAIFEPKPIQILNQEHVPDEIKAIFDFTTASGNPRIYKNGILALAPDSEKLPLLYRLCSSIHAWKLLTDLKDYKEFNKEQKNKVNRFMKEEKTQLISIIRITYTKLFFFVDSEIIENRTIQSTGPLTPYERIVEVLKLEDRIIDSLRPSKLLPSGGYRLWREGVNSLPVEFIIGAFYRFPRLSPPKKPEIIYEAIETLVQEGQIVLKITRPDGSFRTFWRESIDENIFNNPNVELILSSHAELSSITPDVLEKGNVSQLWPENQEEISLKSLIESFNGINYPKLQSDSVVKKALKELALNEKICVIDNNESYTGKYLWFDPLSDAAKIRIPPPKVDPSELHPESLGPECYIDNKTSLEQLKISVSKKRGYPVPTTFIIESVTNAIKSRRLALVNKSLAWPPSTTMAIGNYELSLTAEPPSPPFGDLGSTTDVDSGPTSTTLFPPPTGTAVIFDSVQKIYLDLKPSIAEVKSLIELIEKLKTFDSLTWDLNIRLEAESDEIDAEILEQINSIVNKFWSGKKFLKL